VIRNAALQHDKVSCGQNRDWNRITDLRTLDTNTLFTSIGAEYRNNEVVRLTHIVRVMQIDSTVVHARFW